MVVKVNRKVRLDKYKSFRQEANAASCHDFFAELDPILSVCFCVCAHTQIASGHVPKLI